jgi:poly(3-hydroxybutyrate) depolymerase
VAFFLHGKGFPNMKHQGKMFLSGPHEASSWVHSYHFIGVYPTSDFGWNTDGDLDGDKCTYKQYNCTADNNDVQFIWDIAAWLASKGSTGRVYAYGATDGAALAQKLAANSGNNGGLINGLIISGIWASGGQLRSAPEQSGPGGLYNQPSTVQPRNTPPVAQATSHGDEDQVVPYEGGKSQLHKNCPECTFMSEERSAAVWAKHNGCDMSTPVETQWYECTFGSQKNNTKGWGKRQFYQCPETAPVEFWQIQGAPRGDAETFSITFKDANHTKIEKVVEFFVRVEKASLPPPAPPPSIGKRIEDWASEELPYTMVTVIAAAVCCVCMCMGGLCSK